MSDRIEKSCSMSCPAPAPEKADLSTHPNQEGKRGWNSSCLTFLGKPVWMWLTFLGVVIALMVLRPGRPAQGRPRIGVAESLKLSAFYIALGVALRRLCLVADGTVTSGQAVPDRLRGGKDAGDGQRLRHRADLHLFRHPAEYQHRVLFWGILGVIVLRGIMIGLGAALVSEYHWVLYIFAAFLIFTGIKMLVTDDQHMTSARTRAALPEAAKLNVTEGLHGRMPSSCRQPRPQDRQAGAFATPLFLALVRGGNRRPDLRGGFGARGLRHHHRPVHRLHLEHLRHPGPARAVLRAGGDHPPLPLSEICAGDGAGVHRVEDLRRRPVGLGEVSRRLVAGITFALLAAGSSGVFAVEN
jgi:hypothetical protein